MYKCIKSFSVDRYDDDGFLMDGEYEIVEEGTLWGLDEDCHKIIGGEVRLTKNFWTWLEIPKESLEEYFVKVGDIQDER